MDLKLKGRTALITGSTSGIGFATARKLLEEGVQVTINGRNKEGVNEAVQKLQVQIQGAPVTGIAADFSRAEDIHNIFQELPAVDILINNVGIYTSQSFFDTTDNHWLEQFEVNVMSGVRMSRFYLPRMMEKNWGRIVFISSECASLVPEDLIAYSMTKAGIQAVSRGLAQLTKGSNVTVNTVMPGSTLSEGAENFLASVAVKQGMSRKEIERKFFRDVRTSSLLQRFATVDEIASAIVYISSPLSAATNGSVIKVDGGSTGGIL